jgi:hypothetical protein
LIKVKNLFNSAAIDIANKLYKIATPRVIFLEPWGINGNFALKILTVLHQKLTKYENSNPKHFCAKKKK